MNKIPKELTVELLSLVMGCKVSKNMSEQGIVSIRGISNHEDGDSLDFGYQGLESCYGRYVWVDTLTRLMSDFMFDNGFNNYIGKRKNLGAIEHYCCVDGMVDCTYGENRFEAVLKATHWVAKEKGYIKC